ncbi:MAG TPA: gas vesicle protein GvpG [Egibacteraceae bacterium]|nr:gas vesicle protein GvpG [Actinomycetota bacterium]HWB70800.1 gas vesicle protein GvpG [Egibacteraceae bacterium]
MGLLRALLTLPVSGPVRVAWWVIDQVVAAAEAELYDEGRILEQLRLLADQVEAGEIDEEQHAAAEALLLERLVEARSRHAESTAELP